MNRFTREQMATRVARDIPEGAYVNLGIGLPTIVANFLPKDREIFLHSENGLLGMGPAPASGREDPDLINAGKQPVTLLTGGAYFHHADSFAMMRGGHLDICVLGAFQVSVRGDLANWHTGAPDAIPAVGGAMDLAIGAKSCLRDDGAPDEIGRKQDRCAMHLSALPDSPASTGSTRIWRSSTCCPRDCASSRSSTDCSFDELQRMTGVPLARVRARDVADADPTDAPSTTTARLESPVNDAFICDAIRTPIGRYGGALATVRTDDLAAIPIAALMARNRGVDWAAVDDVVYGCANQAGEDNRNVGRMALLLAGLPVDVAGDDGQPPVRVEHGRDRDRGAGHQERRDVADDRRRRREHVARAVRHGQGDRGILARREARGHDARLALRQSADEGEIRRRQHAGDRRERRRRLRHRARRPGRVRAAQPAARGSGDRRRPIRRRNRRGDDSVEKGRPDRSSTATSIRARRRSNRSPS